jgi:hypothetical protein
MRSLRTVATTAFLLFGVASVAQAQGSSAPSPDPAAAGNPAVKSANDSTGALAKGHNSFTKGQAKSRIEEAGYADVAGLGLDSDGLWQATATKDGQSVHVALDYKGVVAAQ